jgi:ribosome-associated toxin RatA of RatAB toxin-antitoxin module
VSANPWIWDDREMHGRVTVTELVEASPDAVYDLVSDLSRMAEWSPESSGGHWITEGGPRVGARFAGHNQLGRHRWSTRVTVTAADRGRRFAFRVTAPVVPIADWEFRLQPTDGGCQVEQSWVDLRWPPIRFISALRTGVADRRSFNRESMRKTLEAVKVEAEASSAE